MRLSAQVSYSALPLAASLTTASMEDLTALRKLDMVIKSGWRIDCPAVKKLPQVERELDKFL